MADPWNSLIKVYRLHRPAATGAPISLSFVRSLYGHTAGISALRVADGRCVSLGREGCLWVWNLEDSAGRGISIGSFSGVSEDRRDLAELEHLELDGHTLSVLGTNREALTASFAPPVVLFDEQRVVTSLGRENVDIWHFDL